MLVYFCSVGQVNLMQNKYVEDYEEDLPGDWYVEKVVTT